MTGQDVELDHFLSMHLKLEIGWTTKEQKNISGKNSASKKTWNVR